LSFEDADSFRKLVEQAPVPVLVVVEGSVTYANAAAVEFKGEPVVGLSALDQLHPDDQPLAAERLSALLGGGEREQALTMRVNTTRGWVWSELTAVHVIWDGRPAVQVVVVDLQSRRDGDVPESREGADASATLFRTVISSLAEGLVVLAPDGKPKTWNQSALDILSVTAEELRSLDESVVLSIVRDDHEPLPVDSLGAAGRAFAAAENLTNTVLGYSRPGTPRRWLSCNTRTLPDGSRVVSLHNVTVEKEASDKLTQLARYDQLTGLPNRSLGLERLAGAVARVRRSGTPSLAVLFIDVDGFKRVNDTYGHAAGDELLVALADRLRRAVRPADTVARFGGDEFVLVAENVNGVAGAEGLAERVCMIVQPPVQLGANDVTITISVGITLAGAGETADVLLAQADTALYRAKARGRARYELFDESMRTRANHRLALEGDLRRAIALRALRVFYQPQVNISTGQVTGFEALVRWDHPELGALEPAEFVALAEDTGLITALGEVVLAEALLATRQWHADGIDVPVAVNLSARQLDEPGLADSVAEAMAAVGAAPSWLALEITESALTEPSEAAMTCLRLLRDRGIHLSMDDFGTGSSSLAALRTLPVDSIKLDRRFQQDVESDPAARAVVAAVLQLVRALGLTAVAEGVESVAQLAALGELGCEIAQGYLLGHAMPLEEVGPFVRSARPA